MLSVVDNRTVLSLCIHCTVSVAIIYTSGYTLSEMELSNELSIGNLLLRAETNEIVKQVNFEV